jgi:hypothetical protein
MDPISIIVAIISAISFLLHGLHFRGSNCIAGKNCLVCECATVEPVSSPSQDVRSIELTPSRRERTRNLDIPDSKYKKGSKKGSKKRDD